MTRRSHQPSALLLLAATLLLGGALAGGCAQKAGEIFPALEKPIVWPEPPERPRVSYVGRLSTSADLKPPVSFGQKIGEVLFGKKPTHAMLTPYAVCTDGGERLFVADSNAQLVHVMNLGPSRKYEQWKPANGAKRFGQPVGITFDPTSGTLFVADSADGCVYAFDSSGRNIGALGRDFLERPCGVAFDAAKQRLFVADAGTHQVVLLSAEGSLIQRLGQRGTAPGEFNYPTNVALDSQGRLYVSDSLNFRVQQFSADLQAVAVIGRKGDMPGYFAQPKGLAVDSQDHLYVVDSNFEAVQIFDPAGALLLTFGQEGRAPGEFWLPSGVFIDGRDRIWVADGYNRRVQVFDYLPEVEP